MNIEVVSFREDKRNWKENTGKNNETEYGNNKIHIKEM